MQNLFNSKIPLLDSLECKMAGGVYCLNTPINSIKSFVNPSYIYSLISFQTKYIFFLLFFNLNDFFDNRLQT